VILTFSPRTAHRGSEEENRGHSQGTQLPRRLSGRFLQRHRDAPGSERGFLDLAPESVKREFPQLKAVESHAELLKLIKGALAL
jgi:hypothetical protein